jgi:hypothetical protein
MRDGDVEPRLDVCKRLAADPLVHVPRVRRPVGCSAGALEARIAVQRRANRIVRSFACGCAGVEL